MRRLMGYLVGAMVILAAVFTIGNLRHREATNDPLKDPTVIAALTSYREASAADSATIEFLAHQRDQFRVAAEVAASNAGVLEKRAKATKARADSLERVMASSTTAQDSLSNAVLTIAALKDASHASDSTAQFWHDAYNNQSSALATAQAETLRERQQRERSQRAQSVVATAVKDANTCYAVRAGFVKLRCPSRTTTALLAGAVGGGVGALGGYVVGRNT